MASALLRYRTYVVFLGAALFVLAVRFASTETVELLRPRCFGRGGGCFRQHAPSGFACWRWHRRPEPHPRGQSQFAGCAVRRNARRQRRHTALSAGAPSAPYRVRIPHPCASCRRQRNLGGPRIHRACGDRRIAPVGPDGGKRSFLVRNRRERIDPRPRALLETLAVQANARRADDGFVVDSGRRRDRASVSPSGEASRRELCAVIGSGPRFLSASSSMDCANTAWVLSTRTSGAKRKPTAFSSAPSKP